MPWGWLEVVVIAQFLFPILTFLPFLMPIRTLLRVGAYSIPLVAWAAIVLKGRRAPGRPFPARPWMAFSAAWLGLMVFHPTTSNPVAGVAAWAMYVGIFCPAFWAPAEGTSPARIRRLLAILLVCNAASVLTGILQFYRPGQFIPPTITEEKFKYLDGLKYETADGQTVMRPPGLTDSPGGACAGGVYTAIIGLSWAILPIAWWKRLACMGLTAAGMAVIYFTQVRSALVLVVASQVLAGCLLAFRRDFGRLTQLGVVGGLVFAASLAWAARSGGEAVLSRFTSLLEGSTGEVYMKSRGGFLEETFSRFIWDYPLGAGLGRWGMISASFGTPTAANPPLWVEIQPTGFVFDGGIPLLVAYAAGVVMALASAARIAVRSRDPDLWGAGLVLGTIGLTTVINCLSYVPFHSTAGVLFWVGLGSLHGAAQRAEVAARARSPRRPPRPAPGPASRPVPTPPPQIQGYPHGRA